MRSRATTYPAFLSAHPKSGTLAKCLRITCGDWFAHSQQGTLRDVPLVIVSRNPENQDPTDKLEAERLRAQANLLTLSSNSIQLVVKADHNIHISSPDTVVLAVRIITNDLIRTRHQ